MDNLLLKSWEISLQTERFSDHTRKVYVTSVRLFHNFLGRPFVEATRHDIRSWVVELHNTNRSASTIKIRVGALKKFYAWLVDEEEIETNPVHGVKIAPVPMPDTPVLSSDEIRALLKTCDGKSFTDIRNNAILRLFLDCGLRLSELADITVDRVDVDTGSVLVYGKGSNRQGKKSRVVQMGANCTRAMIRYLRKRDTHQYAELPDLWLGRQGKLSVRYFAEIVESHGRKAGIPGLHPHIFRHTWADRFRSAGGREGDLMVLGGWTNRSMLDRYGRSNSQERARDAAKQLSLGDNL